MNWSKYNFILWVESCAGSFRMQFVSLLWLLKHRIVLIGSPYTFYQCAIFFWYGEIQWYTTASLSCQTSFLTDCELFALSHCFFNTISLQNIGHHCKCSDKFHLLAPPVQTFIVKSWIATSTELLIFGTDTSVINSLNARLLQV